MEEESDFWNIPDVDASDIASYLEWKLPLASKEGG